MAEPPRKIAPPPPIIKSDRKVLVPPTVGEFDTTGTPVNVGKTRADFREEEFVRVLRQHGKFVIWRKSMLCTCINAVTGQVEIDCNDCDGSGYVYLDPIDIQAHMVSFDKSMKLYEKFGLWQEGNVSITVEPQYRLGYRDSITMKDSLMSFNEILKKNNRRGFRSTLPSNVDCARYRIVNLTRIAAQLDGANVLLSPDDYSIDKNGWIEWTRTGNRRIPEGTNLSVLYDFHPIFIVVSWPHASRDDTSGRKSKGSAKVISLPIQAMAKLDFIVNPGQQAIGGSETR